MLGLISGAASDIRAAAARERLKKLDSTVIDRRYRRRTLAHRAPGEELLGSANGEGGMSAVTRRRYGRRTLREQGGEGRTSGLKSNPRLGWWWWQSRRINEIHHPLKDGNDSGFVDVETLFQFLFERGELLCQLPPVTQQGTHF
jgi:hypothetical protein